MLNGKSLVVAGQRAQKKYRENPKVVANRTKHLPSVEDKEQFGSTIAAMYGYLHPKRILNDKKYQGFCDDTVGSMEAYLQRKIEEILDFPRMQQEEITVYINEGITPYYGGRFLRSYSREISFLPLELRLKIYDQLYRQEEVRESRWHLRDRLAITLGKLGYGYEGQLYHVLNWLEDIALGKEAYANDELQAGCQVVEQAKEQRDRILAERGYEANNILEELQHSIASFSELDHMMDRESGKMMIGVLGSYFSDYPGMEQVVERITAYIKTGSKAQLGLLEGIKKTEFKPKYQQATLDEKGYVVGQTMSQEQTEEHEAWFKKILGNQ